MKRQNLLYFLLMLFCSITVDAQIKEPTLPQIQQPQPINQPNSPNWQNAPTINNNTGSGNTAQDIIDQSNKQAMIMMGNTPPQLPPKDPYLLHQFILKGYETEQMKQQKELQTILDEINKEERYKQPTININVNYAANDLVAKTKPFNDALKSLNDMITGTQKLSVADAYFIAENAYGGNYLTQKEYKTILTKSAQFIKTWMQQNKLSLKNKEQVHFAIQKFMSEKLTTIVQVGTLETGIKINKSTHQPFFYDYEDYTGEQDQRSYFTTKCLATGSGQCSSMPIVYISLAEALGIKTYLTLAPNHSFVKYIDNNGTIQNYEPTSNWKIEDTWYMDNLTINNRALQSGIYLDTLNDKQIIGDCIINLAIGYMRKYGVGDGKFVEDCMKAATTCYPKNNSIALYLTKSSYLTGKIQQIVKQREIKSTEQIYKSPEATKLFKELQQNEAKMLYLGYEPQPKGQYEEMLKQHEFKGQLQVVKGIKGKQKRNLFTTTP